MIVCVWSASASAGTSPSGAPLWARGSCHGKALSARTRHKFKFLAGISWLSESHKHMLRWANTRLQSSDFRILAHRTRQSKEEGRPAISDLATLRLLHDQVRPLRVHPSQAKLLVAALDNCSSCLAGLAPAARCIFLHWEAPPEAKSAVLMRNPVTGTTTPPRRPPSDHSTVED